GLLRGAGRVAARAQGHRPDQADHGRLRPADAAAARGELAMRVAIVGAGVAGLCTAKVLRQAGHEVTVYDKAPDVGGGGDRARRYPGLTTQSPKAQYSLSDFPMPRDYPQWPTGAQIQAYLAAYATHFGLDPVLRLSTEVTSAVPAPGGGWTVSTAAGA